MNEINRRELMQSVGVLGASAIGANQFIDTAKAQSDGPTNEISGVVETESGPLENATVVAVPHDISQPVLETTTDSNGEYIFTESDLIEGDNLYIVIAYAGTESTPLRSEQNYPFVAATGVAPIPDSALLHFPLLERSNSTIVEELQGADGTANNGLTNTSGNYWEGYAESSDGTDDYADLGDWSVVNFGTRMLDNWGLAMTISGYSGGDRVTFLGQADTTTPGFQLQISDENANSPSGDVELVMTDRTGSGNVQVIGGAPIADGGTYRIMVGGDGPAAQDKVVFVNAVDETSVLSNPGDHTADGNFTISMTSHARNRASGLDQYANCTLDNIIPLDTKPTASVAQDDYDNQPWS